MRRSNSTKIGVIDIFAGPGGLGEGFSSFQLGDTHPFEIAVSAEAEASAHRTLRLRSFYRQLSQTEGALPQDYLDYLRLIGTGRAPSPEEHFGSGKWADLWKLADAEALNLTLGVAADDARLLDRIASVRDEFAELVLIGGPPCQAYSLVGRSKMGGRDGFHTQGDRRHFLYKQYLSILERFTPAAFIMENVKGLLTSKVGGNPMFDAIIQDLSDPSAALSQGNVREAGAARYEILHLSGEDASQVDLATEEFDPRRFVVRSELHGVPQARHRVIILGVRSDVWRGAEPGFHGLKKSEKAVDLIQALSGLPQLRSGLSRQPDDAAAWAKAFESQKRIVVNATRNSAPKAAGVLLNSEPAAHLPRAAASYTKGLTDFARNMRKPGMNVVLNHETRGHMPSDLGRYMFCAAYAMAYDKSPVSSEFPRALRPEHKNWKTGAFADRFRVQMQLKPSSTVTSHLSKDGHAFIHWDPEQCRSLTVREAARLQTFPDDYLFLGNRTQQYVQVGNAVPPLLARQIAGIVCNILMQ